MQVIRSPKSLRQIAKIYEDIARDELAALSSAEAEADAAAGLADAFKHMPEWR